MRRLILLPSFVVVGGLLGGAATAIAGERPAPAYAMQLDVRAQTARQPLPYYRQELKAVGVQGRVVVHAVIAADGSVRPDLASVSGHPLLAKAAVAAMKRWEFQPAGDPVDLTVAFNFTLERRSRLARRGAEAAAASAAAATAVGAEVLVAGPRAVAKS